MLLSNGTVGGAVRPLLSNFCVSLNIGRAPTASQIGNIPGIRVDLCRKNRIAVAHEFLTSTKEMAWRFCGIKEKVPALKS